MNWFLVGVIINSKDRFLEELPVPLRVISVVFRLEIPGMIGGHTPRNTHRAPVIPQKYPGYYRGNHHASPGNTTGNTEEIIRYYQKIRLVIPCTTGGNTPGIPAEILRYYQEMPQVIPDGAALGQIPALRLKRGIPPTNTAGNTPGIRRGRPREIGDRL